MRNLKLNVGEIYIVISLLNSQKGTLEDLNTALKIMDKAALTDEEKKEVGFEQSPGNVSWKNIDWTKDIELNENQYKLLKETLDKKDEVADWTMSEARSAVSFKEKIEGAEKVEEAND